MRMLDYAKFGVSNLFFFSKVIEENFWGVDPLPSLVKEKRYLNEKNLTHGRVMATISKFSPQFFEGYRYMYLKIAWYLKTYIDTNSSIDFEKLH